MKPQSQLKLIATRYHQREPLQVSIKFIVLLFNLAVYTHDANTHPCSCVGMCAYCIGVYVLHAISKLSYTTIYVMLHFQHGCYLLYRMYTLTICTRTLVGAPAAHTNTCSHAVNGGQNLCYVCHQREVRNMPVSMKKYRQQQEHLEAKMLEEYMKQSKALSIVLELKKRSEMKKYNEEVAAYNLAVAQQAMVCPRYNTKMIQGSSSSFHYDRKV